MHDRSELIGPAQPFSDFLADSLLDSSSEGKFICKLSNSLCLIKVTLKKKCPASNIVNLCIPKNILVLKNVLKTKLKDYLKRLF